MIRLQSLAGAIILASSLAAIPAPSPADVFVGAGVGIGIGIGISVNIAPPALPVYVQPPCVVADAIWTPGYWAYGEFGYYWVPGTWVTAPRVGYLWTPGYWGYANDVYAWHAGYWGPHVGFYGGVNYGFGYGGHGYVGGGWSGNHFAYNTAVTNVNTTIVNNVYVNRTVINNYDDTTVNRVSYNGGPGGVRVHETADDVAYRNEAPVPMTAAQRQHETAAAQNRNYLASVNHGAPRSAAVAAPLNEGNRPVDFAPVSRADQRPAVRPGTNAFDTGGMRSSAPSEPNARAERPAQPVDDAMRPTPARPSYAAPSGPAEPPYAAARPQRPAGAGAPSYANREPSAYHAPAYHPAAYHAPAYHPAAYHPAAPHPVAARPAESHPAAEHRPASESPHHPEAHAPHER